MMKQRTKKTLAISAAILGGLLLIYSAGELLAPGSYAYAEYYELDYPEPNVINAINKFKSDNPEMVAPVELNDGRGNSNNYWYKIYFYLKSEIKIVLAWTRSLEKNKTTFALVSFNDGLRLGSWKQINHDFTKSENKRLKLLFEDKVLKQINRNL